MNRNSNKEVNGELKIDERLASQSQLMVRQMVRELPEDVPSLAWRSALNAKISEQSGKAQKRRRIWLVLSPSVGLVATAALCIALFMPSHRNPTPFIPSAPVQASAPSLEDQLVASHSDSDTSQDVVGSGLTAAEVQQNNDDPDAQDAPTS